ncbi:MAG: hypothetical protein HGA19_00025 [Oscillochloris sp.]|nr:hypothetical protein [Oscillochloris sp.]
MSKSYVEHRESAIPHLLQLYNNLFFLASTVSIALYWIAFSTGMKPLVFILGGTILFYLPGAILVRFTGRLVACTSWFEQIGLAVILSIVSVTIMAFVLDFTPFGITQFSLTFTITLLVFAAFALEPWCGHAWTPLRNRRWGIEIFIIPLITLLWAVAMPLLYNGVKIIDQALTARPSSDYLALASSCETHQQETTIILTVTKRGSPDGEIDISASKDGSSINENDLLLSHHTQNEDQYTIHIQEPWQRVIANLSRRDPHTGSTQTMATMVSPNICVAY